ncbi:hypothetical protein [Pontibacter cellulosilyticus]|uniref:Lipoprotein n=1 Tax=Pontibacter cellulosilyticus TaxID=1720253 RepID=A0A923SJP7_9BACT|nr:hypothetical protein [Pontibacter cellulosilyticus]MBC5994119.1 hypothetical protein [Pontibacter cellulosilyticus]
MKKLLYFPVMLTLCLFVFSCTRDVYQRPVTIDKMEFTNKAGEKYDAQFNRVNNWFLLKLKELEREKHTFRIDTAAKKRYRKYNHTLVASLENLEVNGNSGVYYQLYLKPNSGIGKIKGDVQDDRYNELKLYSPEQRFLKHGQQYYNDSIVSGPFRRLITVQKFLKPQNTEQPGIISFSIDSINFSKGFGKRQRESITRIINNGIALAQQNSYGKDPKKAMVFNYYPNYSTKQDKKPASFSVNLNVSQDPVTNKVVVKVSSPGYTPDKFTRTEAKFNRADFFAGHDYEANMQLNSLATGFFSRLYYSQKR